MKNYTLTLIFNKQRDKVLMCWHKKQNALNFVGGKVKEFEDQREASYRELFEETGIGRNDIILKFIREETVRGNGVIYTDNWNMYITYGVLEHDIVLKDEKNKLEWISIYDTRIDNNSMGYGNCRIFLNEALEIMKKESEYEIK